MIPDLIVRADAGPDVGLGHLVRSAALAEAWQDAGGRVVLATAGGADLPASVDLGPARVVDVGARHPDPADAAAMARLIAASPGAWVSCDGYHFDADYARRMRRAGARVLVIDDAAHQPLYHADVLLNQNPGAERLSYTFDTDPICLFGPRFALLSRAFRARRGSPRATRAEPRCLLVTVGGSAAGRAAGKIARGCVRFLSRHRMRAVVLAGPGGSAAAWADALKDAGGAQLAIVTDPADVPALMADADFAVSAAGSTVWQLCFVGVPALLVTVAANQDGIAKRLEDHGCAVSLGRLDDLDESRLAGLLEQLAGDAPARARMSRRGRDLVDGMGAERVAAALLKQQEDVHATV